jgi:SAM-dependent methyltransferase
MNGRESPPGRLEEVDCYRCRARGERLYPSGRFAVAKCPSCGQVFISPRLVAEDRGGIYDDPDYFEAGVYGFKKRFSLSLWHQQTWSNGRLKLLGSGQGRKLLEMGCAYGFFLNVARQHGFQVSGVEISRAAVLWAREKTDLDVRQGTVESVTLPEHEYDVVCFWDVLEHVPDPAFFLATVARALKPGGVVGFSCPDFSSLPARVFRGRWRALKPEQHIWQFTPQTLTRALAEAGLAQVRIIRSLFAPANLGRVDSVVVIARAQVPYVPSAQPELG